jgi:hypothetical protein
LIGISMRITALVEPFVGSEAEGEVSERTLYEVDEFSTRLGRAAGTTVPIVEGSWEKAPDDGFILLFNSWKLAEHPALRPRSVVVNLSREQVPRNLEDYQLAAGVESYTYFRWLGEPDGDHGAALFGRRDVAALISANFLGAPHNMTENYAILASPLYKDLPGLLAGYLGAYEQVHRGLVHP